ncbi:aminoglycoside phosphotransferase family protein [Roseibium salinum]|nr:aminoglycoside phosphotransferase family protein [Roseibium salinum]
MASTWTWPDPPFAGGCVSFVLPVTRPGADAVLKLQFLDRETRHEADALKAWNGNGAIRLLDHAPEIGALLLERCRPGRFLAEGPRADKLDILADLLRRLLIPADAPFARLQEEAGRWAQSMENNWRAAGKPCEKYLVEAAVSALGALSCDDPGGTLLHQDLHGHNILSAEREPWLAIDPKPLVGDPAFCLSPIVRSFEIGHSKSAALLRLDRLSEDLELDRERARFWTIGQTMAWSFSSPCPERHFDTARWLLVR